MDYLPEIIIDPSHERLQIVSLGGSTGAKPSFPDDFHLASYLPESAHDVVPEDHSEETWIQHVLCDLFSSTLARVLTLIRNDENRPTAAVDKSKGIDLVSKTALSNILKSLAKKRFEDNATLSLNSHVQNDRVQEILRDAMRHLQDVSAMHPTGTQRGLHSISKAEVAAFSLQCLIETLYDLTLPKYQLSAYYSIADPHPFWIENSMVNHMLRDAGWDRGIIDSLPKDIRFRYYLSFLRKGPQELRRRRSSALPPRNKPHLKQHYSPSHTFPYCNCATLKVYLDTTDKGLDNPYFNLVSLSQHEGCPSCLQLHERSLSSGKGMETLFVAFSHVRSDGLGSSVENALPTCQLELLQDWSNRLLPQQERPVPFYVDTLCVPLIGSAKRIALRNMQYVFGNASKVLVLDNELSGTTASPLPQENLTRIRYSVFMRRLFTVAECAVSQNVYFRFKYNTFVSLNDLHSSYDRDGEFPLLSRVSLKDRRRNTLTLKELEYLQLPLAMLTDDLHVLEMYSREQAAGLTSKSGPYEEVFSAPESWTVTPGVYNKFFLRRLLRLGFLALPQMRYFAEATEAEILDDIANRILQVYRDTVNEVNSEAKLNHEKLLPSHIPGQSSISRALNRLGKLQPLANSLFLDK
jgi:hypothetical protein